MVALSHPRADLSEVEWSYDATRGAVCGTCHSPEDARVTAQTVNENLEMTFASKAAVMLGDANQGQMRATTENNKVVVQNITPDEFAQANHVSLTASVAEKTE